MALGLKSLHQLPLLLRRDPAEHRVLGGGPAQPFLGVHPAHIHPCGGVLQPGPSRYGGGRGRVVAGDDFYRYPLPPEVGQGVRRSGPSGVGEHQGGQDSHFRKRRIRIDRIRGGGDHQHSFALLNLRPQFLREVRTCHAVRRAYRQRTHLREGHGAPLALGGEGDLSHRLQRAARMGEIAPHGLEGGVIVVAVGQKRPHPFRQRDRRVFRQRDHPLQAHIPLGEGAGLIQAQHIHMGQALQGKQVLRQHPGSCQLGYPHRQTDGDQQHQPLGEHPQQAGGGGGHRVKHRRSPQEICLEKQEQPQRRDQESGKAGHLPHGSQQL